MNNNIPLPCPFCNSPAKTAYRSGEYKISCPECEVFICGKSARETLDKWNRRAPQPTKKEKPAPEYDIKLYNAIAATAPICANCRYYAENRGHKFCHNSFSSKTEVHPGDWCLHFER